MLNGELVAFLQIVLGGILSIAYYLFVGIRTGAWLVGVEAGLSILANCFTIVPAAYFLFGVIIEFGEHLVWRGDPPVIPLTGNEPTLVVVFAYAVFLCVGSNFRIYRAANAAQHE